MGDFNDHIKNTFDGEEIPFNPEHWEQMKERLNQSPAPTSFEEGAKNIFESASVLMAAGSWDQFAQKLNEAQSTPFENAVKDKFAEAEVPYNENHWNNISEKISSSFERKAKDILTSKEVAYNAQHWAQMEAMLDSGQKTGGFFNWKSAAAAVLILLGCATYAMLNSNDKEDSTADKSSLPIEEKTSQSSEQNLSASAATEHTKTATGISSASEEKNSTSVNKNSSSKNSATIEKNISSNKNKGTNIAVNNKKKKDKQANNTREYTNTAVIKNTVENNNEFEIATIGKASMGQNNFAFNEIAMANKTLTFDKESFDTLSTQALAPDYWDGMIFKYTTLPSSLPSSVLSNIWEQPAIAGIDRHTAVKFMYNSPWENKVINRTTGEKEFHLLEPANMYLSVDGAVGKDQKLSVGGYYHRIHNNDWQSDNINFTLSYTHVINKFTQIRGGIAATYSNNALNTNNLNFWQKTDAGAMLVANDQSVNNPERYINYKAGLWLNHPLLFAGFTLDNIFQTTVTKKPELQLSSTAIAGINIPFTKKYTVTAYAKRTSNINALYTAGAMLSYNNKLFAGASYENSNFATITMGCNIKDQLRLHMSWGIMANKESLYIDDTNKGFITAGVRYLISPSKKSLGAAL